MIKRLAYISLALLCTSVSLTQTGCENGGAEMPDGSSSLRFTARVESMGGASESSTKGALINTGSSAAGLEAYSSIVGSFNVSAWTGSVQFLNDGTVRYSDGVWQLQDDTRYMWKYDETKTFVAYANLPSGASVGNISSTGQTLTVSSLPASAANQKDILLGYFTGQGNNTKGVAQIAFCHPLTAVVFNTGIQGATLNSVSIKGVYSGGTYSHTGGAAVSDAQWSGRTGSITVSGTASEPFLLIPQSLSAQPVTVTANITANGRTYNMTTTLNSGAWQPGYVTTYSIDYNSISVANVQILGSSNTNTISNVSVRNTGTENIWIRAAIVANWVDDEGLIMSPCDISGVTASGWTRQPDGFYYCNSQLQPGNQITLISTVTKPAPPISGLTLEFSVSAQGTADNSAW